jgi:hypothetical protein
MRSDTAPPLRLLALCLWLLLALSAHAGCCGGPVAGSPFPAQALDQPADGACASADSDAGSCVGADPDPQTDCCSSDRSAGDDSPRPECPCCDSGQCAQQAHRCCSCSGQGAPAGSGLLADAAGWAHPPSQANLIHFEGLGPAAAHDGAPDHPPRS